MLKNHTIWIFWYLWISTPPGYVFWPYFAVFQDPTQFWAWGTLLGHNECWKSKFGPINYHTCKFEILLSSGLLLAFLLLEFKIKSFFNLLGPNETRKVKKYKNVIPFLLWTLIWPLWPSWPFLAFYITLMLHDVL